MPTIAVENGEIYFEECGSGDAVVLAHGIGGNHAIWYQQLPELSKHFRIITFDHRGFGNSVDSGGLGRSAFVSDLVAILDHLKIERAALIGQSMGGGTCIGFANAYPERTSALVMCDSLHGIVESDAVKKLMDVAREASKNLDQLERVLGDRTRLNDPEKSLLYKQLNSFNASNRHNLGGTFAPLVAPDELASLGVPVLFLVGESDVLFPPEAVRQVHAEVAKSTFVEVKGAGHSVFFEDPNAFNSLLLSFLNDRLNQDLSRRHFAGDSDTSTKLE